MRMRVTQRRQRNFTAAAVVWYHLLLLHIVHAWVVLEQHEPLSRCHQHVGDKIDRRRHCSSIIRPSNPTILYRPTQRHRYYKLQQMSLKNSFSRQEGGGDTNDFDDDVEQEQERQVLPKSTTNHPNSLPYYNRRQFVWSNMMMILTSTVATTTVTTTILPKSVAARGLVHFPCILPLANSYHLMRVGTTLLEEQGMWSTNPLFLTNRDDALSLKGVDQVVETCRRIQQDEKQLPTLIKYSLAASCIDTATIVGQELTLGTDRIVPEFTFLDPRGIGGWDMSARDMTIPALWAMDNDEAGTDGLHALPPSSDDGTPHEVLADQAVRLRQILSILESQYSGDTILLIFPDGTGPALLSAMIAGIPYNRVHELEYQPGEIRFDVTMESTLALWKEKQSMDGKTYEATLRKGRATLKELRTAQKNGGTVTNLKDQRIEEERINIENEHRKKQQQRKEAELEEESLRIQRHRDIIDLRQNTDVLDIGTETTLGLSSIVGAGMASWYYSSSRNVPIINATEMMPTDSRLPLFSNQLVLERHNFSNSSTGFYSTPVDRSLNRRDTGREGSGGLRNDDSKVMFVMDPKEKARIAMEEYMDRDDGADDWLSSLSQIIEESIAEDIETLGYNKLIVNGTNGGEYTVSSSSTMNAKQLSKLNVNDFVYGSETERPFQ